MNGFWRVLLEGLARTAWFPAPVWPPLLWEPGWSGRAPDDSFGAQAVPDDSFRAPADVS